MRLLPLAFLLCAVSPVLAQETVNVFFETGKHALTSHTTRRLDSFLLANRKTPPGISLDGYCDIVGNDALNDALSNRRVTAVQEYLVQHGFPASRIIAQTGHGKREPVNGNATPEERQANRRVQLTMSSADTVTSTLQQQLNDSTVKSGSNIVLRNIHFYGGRHQFLPGSTPMLQELLEAMRNNPKLVIQVEGHICCEPGDKDGLDMETGYYNLSETRAKAVMDYLIGNGVAASRISYKGFGHSRPIHPFPEQNEEQMEENRRVEIRIISR